MWASHAKVFDVALSNGLRICARRTLHSNTVRDHTMMMNLYIKKIDFFSLCTHILCMRQRLFLNKYLFFFFLVIKRRRLNWFLYSFKSSAGEWGCLIYTKSRTQRTLETPLLLRASPCARVLFIYIYKFKNKTHTQYFLWI